MKIVWKQVDYLLQRTITAKRCHNELKVLAVLQYKNIPSLVAIIGLNAMRQIQA